MYRTKVSLYTASAMAVIAAMQPSVATAQTAPPAAAPTSSPNATEIAEAGDIVVTAQKREQRLQDVGASITAVTGAKLIELGITETSQLYKIVPGFSYTTTVYGTSVFSIRGVGFQDNSLAGGPAVSIYQDEFPLPFASVEQGAAFDLERVEVLKGPQGTLFGQNATGGAVNYIAAKPTSTFRAGGDVSVGRFGTVNVQAFVSGPVTDTLNARVAVQSNTAGAWQKGYGPQEGQVFGGTDFQNARLSLAWTPNNDLRMLLTISGWRDKGYSQAGQTFRTNFPLGNGQLNPAIAMYPIAPHNNRAAGFNQCINTDPFNPFVGQSLGVTYPTPVGTQVSQGEGSVAYEGGQPANCVPARRDNTYYSGSLRVDYDIDDDLTLSSLTSYQKFDRFQANDIAGVPYQVFTSLQTGGIKTFYQELRLAGTFGGRGNWIFGANYENDDSVDEGLNSSFAGSSQPLFIPLSPDFTLVLPLGTVRQFNAQQVKTKAVFGNVEYPVTETISLIAGARYTDQRRRSQNCLFDGGDGTLSQILGGTAGPGECATVGPNGASFGTVPYLKLNEDNVAWKGGLNWKVTPDTLLYASVSKGYKSGSFLTTLAFSYTQQVPVVQESLLSYEAGFKTQFFDRTLTLNGAGFYYNYRNKQIQGSCPTFLGALPCLVNVPKSRVTGAELSAIYTPRWLNGLTLSGSASFQSSKVQKSSRNQCTPEFIASLPSTVLPCRPGDFYNYDQFGALTRITGQRFPEAPEFQASVDASYEWSVGDNLDAFIGANANYTGGTWYSFLNDSPPDPNRYDPLLIPAYTLLDLRAGLEKGAWRGQVWIRNVTDNHYWTQALKASDVFVRYTGLPRTYGLTVSYRY